MAGDGSGIAELNPPLHSIMQREKCGLNPLEMWEAAYDQVITHLKRPGSKARNERGSMSVTAFKKIAKAIWP
jgi:hypothetical protein